MTTLHLTRHGVTSASMELGIEGLVRNETILRVDESTKFGLRISDREPDMDYAAWTGDIPLQAGEGSLVRGSSESLGSGSGTNVFWQDGLYFDSARGLVELRVASRSGKSATWRNRAIWPVYVIPTKLTETRYQAMCEELRRLAAGLLFDLVTKGTQSVQTGLAENKGVFPLSSQLELRLLEQLWKPLSKVLTEILSQPYTTLSSRWEMQPCWGNERFHTGALARMVEAGTDPRSRAVERPFRAYRQRFIDNLDTIEHRVIVGFLEFLKERIEDCLLNIESHVEAIQRDRPLRDVSHGSAISLYEVIDRPRVEQLQEARSRASKVGSQIQAALRTDFLREIRPWFGIVDTPVFLHVAPYYRFRSLIHNYMNLSMVVLDDGVEERLKGTNRLYEQWVFMQLAAAFRSLGLKCASREGMLHRVKHYRYTLDIDRGARLTFLAENGWSVVVRYEPWILPLNVARQRLDTVYRSLGGSTAWSPDILIEFFRAESPTASSVTDIPAAEYAVVVDAKYSRQVHEGQWSNTEKYLQIRSTANRQQVVRQLWLALPLDGEDDITLRDESVLWMENGPSCGRNEQITGVISLIPPEKASEVEESGWLSEPSETAVRFLNGILNYLEIPHGVSRGVKQDSSYYAEEKIFS